jgi:hypothetical protein
VKAVGAHMHQKSFKKFAWWKLMATVFRNRKGALMVEFMQ